MGVDIITDHKYAPRHVWWDRCVVCNLSEAAHRETSMPDSRFPTGLSGLPYRCPDCVTTGALTCPHGEATSYQELKAYDRYAIQPGEDLLDQSSMGEDQRALLRHNMDDLADSED